MEQNSLIFQPQRKIK